MASTSMACLKLSEEQIKCWRTVSRAASIRTGRSSCWSLRSVDCQRRTHKNGSSYVTHSGGRPRVFRLNWAPCWTETSRPPPLDARSSALRAGSEDAVIVGTTDCNNNELDRNQHRPNR
ncbi:hypothetical protein INR49_032769 [Caranx melampygus]|nr:hypothetical protein INR49_032769 [Caranx melampygus]